MSVYSQTSDLNFADVIVRGHEDFDALSKSEQLAFGHFLENMCIANEGALVMANSITRGKKGMTTLFDRHISWHLSSNGGRAWFKKFQHERGFPEDLTQSIHKALG